MPEPSDQPAKPLRTWRPMVLWTAGLLLVLGLVWFVAAAVVAPVWEVRNWVGCAELSPDETVAELGGPEHAARKLAMYMRMPKGLAPDRKGASKLLAACLKSGASSAAAPLCRALADPDPKVRADTAWALGDINAAAVGTLPALINSLADGNDWVRHAAARALGRIGTEAWPAVPALARALRDSAWHVRFRAAVALMCIGPAAAPATPELAKALGDPEAAVRQWAAKALEAIEPAAAAALPELTKALSDKDGDVRSAAARALKGIKGAEPGKP
jgi:hypothetical protein